MDIKNIADFTGAFIVLIAATVIDLGAVAIAFKDFLKKDDKKEEDK